MTWTIISFVVKLDNLRELINSLKSEEIGVVKSHLSSTYHRFGEEEFKPKTLLLFDELINDNASSLSDEEVRLCVNGTGSINSFKILATRLKNTIHDCLLFNINLNRPEAYSRAYAAKFDIRKKISQAEILIGRGLSNQGHKLLNLAIVKAKRFEVYDSLVEALYLKQFLLGLRFGKKQYEALQKEIKFYENSRDIMNQTLQLYYSFGIQKEFKGDSDSFYGHIAEEIQKLELDFGTSDSYNFAYYLNLIKLNLYEQTEDYRNMHRVCMHQINLLETNNDLFQKRRMGSTLAITSNCLIFMGDFELANEYAVRAQSFLVKGTFNALYAKECSLFAHFYDNKIEAASKIADDLLEKTNQGKLPFHYSKRLFVRACILFVQKNYTESNFLLQQIEEIDKDKEGWNIAIRVLMIMNMVEQGLRYHEIAVSYIENLRRHIYETRKYNPIRRRHILVFRILRNLLTKDLNFKSVYRTKKKYFDLLASDDASYSWKTLSPEIIRFDKWFLSNVFRDRYSNLSVPHI